MPLLQDPFGDPSQASLTCVAARPVTVRDEAAIQGSEGKEIFSERKGLNLFQNKVEAVCGSDGPVGASIFCPAHGLHVCACACAESAGATHL